MIHWEMGKQSMQIPASLYVRSPPTHTHTPTSAKAGGSTGLVREQWLMRTELDPLEEDIFCKKEGLPIDKLAKRAPIGLNNGGNPWYIPSDRLCQNRHASLLLIPCIRSQSLPQLSSHPGAEGWGAGGRGTCQIAELFWGSHSEAPQYASANTHTPSSSVAWGPTGGCAPRKTHSGKVSEPVTRKTLTVSGTVGKGVALIPEQLNPFI